MNHTLLTVVIGVLAVGLAVPGSAGAQGLDLEQGASADTDENEDSLQNELEIDNSGYDSAFATANCQLMVLADVWVVAVASAETLGVINDEDELEIARSEYNGGTSVTTQTVQNSDSAKSHCSSPVGPVNIEVQIAEGFGEEAPQGEASDLLVALKASFGGSDARIDQDDYQIEADSDVNDNVKNDMNEDTSGDYGASATGNCQALIGAHSGALSIGLASAEGHVEDSDSISFTMPANDLGTSQTGSTVTTVASQANDAATASCNQSIDSIRLVVGRNGGAGTVPVES